MKLISFDIGIKNMAYCIFEIRQGSQPSIIDWNVLNLMEKETPKLQCNCLLKPKNKKTQAKTCNKTARFSKNDNYYCDKHAKMDEKYIIPTKECSQPSLKKKKVQELSMLCNELLLLDNPKENNYTKPQMLDKLQVYYTEKCFVPIINKKNKSANNTDLISIGKSMKILLNQIPVINDITNVIIENQISPIANRMKTIQGMLAQYFIMNNTDIEIEFISSANKLRDANITTTPVENSNTLREANEEFITQNSIYKKHKIDGVILCSQLLEQNPNFISWKNVLETKKKDDLADCFLQGMWYIRKKFHN
jgi:hypothetical protein